MLMCDSHYYTTCCTPAFSSTTRTNTDKKQHIVSFYTTNPPRAHYKRHNQKTTMMTNAAVASNQMMTNAAVASNQPVDVDYLEKQFGCDGVTFTGMGDSCIIKMGLENGSMVTLMLPTGLITSYKAPMWHGGTLEVLHTTVSEVRGNPVIQGGLSLAFNFRNTVEDGLSWSSTTWALHRVQTSNSADDDNKNNNNSVEVELISIDCEEENMVQVKHIITLTGDGLSSEIAITNNSKSSSSIQFTGSVISHLTVSTPDATYAVGLEGSDFITKPPLVSNFTIIDSSSSNILQEMEEEGEEDDNYKHLTEKMSVIYTCAPRNFTIIDRGRRNSVVIGRAGFEEVYMLSPGSNSDRYTKYDYICVGTSALLKPLIVPPQHTWRGVQHLHNPNL